MMKTILKGGTILDPPKKYHENLDILIEDDKIAYVGPNISVEDAKVIDLSGLIVSPGFFDMHVHLREPGREDKETIATGSMAAVAGGFTAVACMPNTDPINDNQSVTRFILEQAAKADKARVYPIGSISKGLAGKEMSEIGELFSSGIIGISDDGKPVMNSELFRRAIEYTKMFGLPLIEHAEDLALVGKGVMNEGYISTLTGLPAQPGIAEDIIVDRDIRIAEYVGGHIHIAHLSRKKSLEIIRRAKSEGIHVTCEVTPHHLTLTDENLQTFDTNYKMAPPLRTQEDVDSLVEGLLDGTIDAIASDHAPHTVQEKELEFTDAPFGIIGLETSLPVLLTDLVATGKVPLEIIVERFTVGPHSVFNWSNFHIEPGSKADLTIFNPDYKFTIDAGSFYSKSRNTPWHGKKVTGCAFMTIVKGKVVYKHKEMN